MFRRQWQKTGEEALRTKLVTDKVLLSDEKNLRVPTLVILDSCIEENRREGSIVLPGTERHFNMTDIADLDESSELRLYCDELYKVQSAFSEFSSKSLKKEQVDKIRKIILMYDNKTQECRNQLSLALFPQAELKNTVEDLINQCTKVALAATATFEGQLEARAEAIKDAWRAAKNAQTAKQVYNEILTGDEHYVAKGLRPASHQFMHILKCYESAVTEKGHITSNDIRIFDEALRGMLTCHEECLKTFRIGCTECDPRKLEPAFNAISDCIQHDYVRYLNRQDLILRQFTAAQEANSVMKTEVTNMLKDAVFKGLSLNSLLMTPMQRTIAYMLLTERVAKFTVEIGSEEMQRVNREKGEALRRIQSRIKAAVQYMDAETNKLRKLRSLVDDVIGLNWDDYVIEDKALEKTEEGFSEPGTTSDGKKIKIFLMNDQLVVAEKAGAPPGKWSVGEAIFTSRVSSVSCEIKEDGGKAVGFVLAGAITSEQRPFKLQFYKADDDEKMRTWVKQLQDKFHDSMSLEELPEGWETFYDDTQEKFYYYHAATNITQWERPGQAHSGVPLLAPALGAFGRMSFGP